MKLAFRRLTSDYYVANPDGSAVERLGEPIYVVRTTPALLRDHPETPWRASCPDDYIICEGVSFGEARRVCEADADSYHEGRYLDDFWSFVDSPGVDS